MAKPTTTPLKILLDVAVIVHVDPGTNIDAVTEGIQRNAGRLLTGREVIDGTPCYEGSVSVRHCGTVVATENDLPQAAE